MRCVGFCAGLLAVILPCALLPATAEGAERSFYELVTGNGHGYQVFNREGRRIETFLEAPYRFLAPTDGERRNGIGRRDLAHDMYFGIQVGGQNVWLERDTGQSNVEYEEQTNIIHAWSTVGGLRVDTYYFAPFGYEGNGMVALVRVENEGSSGANASVFFKPNLKLGSIAGQREDPGDDGESVTWNDGATTPHAVETGPGGGHAVYLPIGGYDDAGCGADSTLYTAVATGNSPGGNADCSGGSQVMVLGRDLTIGAGEAAWWGTAVLFVNDNPSGAQAPDFADDRDVGDIVAEWSDFLAGRTPQELHDDALSEFETWRVGTAPGGLTNQENLIWRQSEAILRMGQIREPLQANRENFGMILAALPPGEWHMGWVRDAAYGIASLAMIGQHQMAKDGINFFLGADGATHGFFNEGYLGQEYRVSATRYFGNGKEEGDFNADGPNVETDGWGLILWSAGMYMHYSCDAAWLDETTWRGDTVYEALVEVADDITSYVASDLPGADTSIWEVHWDRRQVFTFTAASQIRGLFDFANIAEHRGDAELAQQTRDTATRMQTAMLNLLVYQDGKSLASHLGVAGNPIHVDGSTVEALMWELVEEDDPIYAGTLSNYARLLTPFGGYQRLEPSLSLTGQGQASVYDTSEWILLDLRIGQAYRRTGNENHADQLLNWITDSAAVNDNLIPELYDRNSGDYEGVVPMVGYGAGAWMMTQLEKHGAILPAPDLSLDHCDPDGGDDGLDPGGDEGGNGDGGGDGDGDGGGADGGGADGGGADGGGAAEGGMTLDDRDATFCAVSDRRPIAVWLLALFGLSLVPGVRRRIWG